MLSRLPLIVLVPALALSLGLVSVFAPLMANGTVGRSAQAAGNAAKTCCCGTHDARCCGMACCQIPVRQQENAPGQNGPENYRIEPLVQGVAPLGLRLARANGVRSRPAGALSCAEGLSLQAQHIRLQL